MPVRTLWMDIGNSLVIKLLAGEVTFPQPPHLCRARQQCVKCPLILNLSILEDNNLVGAAQGGTAMGNDQARRSLTMTILAAIASLIVIICAKESLPHCPFRLNIQR